MMNRIRNYGWKLAALVSFLGVSGMVSCSDDDDDLKPIEDLENQMSYNDRKVDIKSVVWECDKQGVYTFYVSPRAGMKTYEDITATNDYLTLETSQVNGDLTQNYRITYGDLKLNADTTYLRHDMEVELVGDQLDLELYAYTASHNELNVDYEGPVVKMEPMVLKNQWQLNRDKAQQVMSLLEWRSTDHTDFYFSTQADVKSPDALQGSDYIQVTLPNPIPAEVDLAQNADVRVVYGQLDSKSAKSVSGALRFNRNELHNDLFLSLEATIDDQLLRADWNGAYAVGYESKNVLDLVTVDGEKTSTALSKVFVNSTVASHCFAFGLKENPASVEDLKDRYAVQFNVSNLNQDLDLSKKENYNLKVYDYVNCKTYDSADEDLEGTLKVWNDGGDQVYFSLLANFKNGIQVASEWYGSLTQTEAFDLTPVPPFRSNFKITQESGEVSKDMDIIGLQVRHNPQYQSNVSGATYSAYEFYFINKYTEGSGVNDAAATPVLVVNDEYIGKENIDLTQNKTIFDFSYLPFNSSGIASPTEYSGTTEQGTLSIKKDGDNWKISFSILDYGNWWGWGGPSGTKAVFSAEWEGPASPYTGK